MSDVKLPNFMEAAERAYKKERKATGKNIKPCAKMQARHKYEIESGTHREYGVKRMTPSERADAQKSAKGE